MRMRYRGRRSPSHSLTDSLTESFGAQRSRHAAGSATYGLGGVFAAATALSSIPANHRSTESSASSSAGSVTGSAIGGGGAESTDGAVRGAASTSGVSGTRAGAGGGAGRG